jgi:hypothetical protein
MSHFLDDSIEKFLKQVKIANDYNSKEIRISTNDAQRLALSLTTLLNLNLTLSQDIIQLQKQLLAGITSSPTTLNLSGGSF